MHKFIRRSALALALLFLQTTLAAAPAWQPVADEVYLQESGSQLPTSKPVWALAIYQDELYLGFGGGVERLAADQALVPLPEVAGFVNHMRVAGNALWVFTDNGLDRFDGKGWQHIAGKNLEDVCTLHGQTYVLADQRIYTYAGGELHPIDGAETSPGPLYRLAPWAESLYCMGYDRLVLFDGKRFQHTDLLEFGALPSKDTRDCLAFGDRLLVATHQGIGVVRGLAATMILGADGLPYDEFLALEAGFGNDFWAGTTKGAIRVVDKDFHYFIGPRWLPDDKVNDIAVSKDTVYLATDKGVGIIHYEPYTLLKKAAYYERHLEEWGQKRMAFVHKLEWNATRNSWMREVSDNDVGWSTHYWAAQAFKYAATKDEAARDAARQGFNAMKWAEEISGIPGFPARSIWAIGETSNRTEGGSGNYPAEWNPTADGQWAWKGDTSSDETDAHFYYASVFYEHAANDSEKELVREHLRRIAGHIVDNGWVLRDLDGKPTVWGRWDLEYLNSKKGSYAWGLNGMEALNYMRTAQALTGDAKFQTAMDYLIENNYTRQVVHQKLVSPPQFVFHSDDRLAFYTYYTLLLYEKDPALRAIFRRSLERSWEVERIEHNPWFNFIYGARTGNPCEEQEAVKHLREWPLDLVKYSYNLTHCRNLYPDNGYIPYAGGKRAFSPRTVGGQRWTNSYLDLEGGGGGMEVEDPSGWLDAYWMGRALGMILPPETTDPELISVPERGLKLGAPDYDGPAMPDVLE
ncbi:MAG: hypothetical protein HYV27_22330 [Candidatus Hydrogenedentes bacterium]|nr:hypothetical protein [Candidatus Hydrogenedentota bacterium]